MAKTLYTPSRGFRAAAAMEGFHRIDRSVGKLQLSLRSVNLLEAYRSIALEHSLSAPVVAVMQVSKAFAAGLGSLPAADTYDIIPEHKGSMRQQLGLEALDSAQGESVGGLCDDARDVVAAVAEALEPLGDTARDFLGQLAEAKAALDHVELTDEILADLDVTSLSDEGYLTILEALEGHVCELKGFDPSEVQANPERIRKEVDGLTALVGKVGTVLGLSVDDSGLQEGTRDEAYIPSSGTFAEKGLTKQSLVFLLDRASGLAQDLVDLAERQSEVVDSLNAGVDEIPADLSSDDVTYGANEHLTLFCCYAKLVSKMLRESVVIIARVLTTADAALELVRHEPVQPVAVSDEVFAD